MLKRIVIIFSISLIISGSFFSVYNLKYPVYADSNTDDWTQVTTNQQLVEAFRYYCKSRDLTIDGSVADAITTFTTKTFNGICNTLGIDVTALQAQIKYQTDGNLGNRFLFSTLGIDAYNRIFAQFLQDNNLSVGDSANQTDNTVYDGKSVIINGNTYLVYMSVYGQTGDVIYPNTQIIQHGSPFLTSAQIWSIFNSGTNTISNLSGGSLRLERGSRGSLLVGGMGLDGTSGDGTDVYSNGCTCIVYATSSNVYYYGYHRYRTYNNTTKYETLGIYNTISLGTNDKQDCTIYLTTNNTTINNNTYEGDTIINNNGDTNNYPDNPDTPDIPDPNPNPTPDPPTIPDSGGWQDFSLPDMPNDWLIYGMEKKFPFDIPFNILFALSLLNHEPEIPKFEGDIDLQVCTWHYDIDLTPFDDIATILRKFEVLGFIIGLAILTKNLINWG